MQSMLTGFTTLWRNVLMAHKAQWQLACYRTYSTYRDLHMRQLSNFHFTKGQDLKIPCWPLAQTAGSNLDPIQQAIYSSKTVDGASGSVGLTNAIGPPACASGETWPMQNPWLPPENLPSVMRAHSFPRPAPMMAAVGLSISGMPGPPLGPSNLITTTVPCNLRYSKLSPSESLFKDNICYQNILRQQTSVFNKFSFPYEELASRRSYIFRGTNTFLLIGVWL